MGFEYASVHDKTFLIIYYYMIYTSATTRGNYTWWAQGVCTAVFTVYFEYIISQLEISNDGWIRYEQGEAYLGLLQKQIKTDAL